MNQQTNLYVRDLIVDRNVSAIIQLEKEQSILVQDVCISIFNNNWFFFFKEEQFVDIHILYSVSIPNIGILSNLTGGTKK